MKSLKSHTIKKLNVLKDKTLAEILEFLEDGKNSAIHDAVFSSREALLAVFEGYMTIHPPDADRIHYLELRSEIRRTNFIKLFTSREDLQTPYELEQFFIALCRGFMWDYVITLPNNPQEGELFTAMARNSVKESSYTLIHELQIIGTLPSDDSMGVNFHIDIFIDNDEDEEAEREQFLSSQSFFWKKDRDASNDLQFKHRVYKSLLKLFSDYLRIDENGAFMTITIHELDDIPAQTIFSEEFLDLDVVTSDRVVDIITRSKYDFTQNQDQELPAGLHILYTMGNYEYVMHIEGSTFSM